MNPIDIALRIATAAHAGQLDRDGYPAILHPLTVGLMGHTDEEKMAGFLHYVVEDTSDTFDKNIEVGIFACGCFWGTQHHFQKQKGVQKTLAGYTGGEEAFPTYADVRDHKTHHVEAIIVEYNPEEVSYESLCKLFFEIHDPAQTDGVGPDIGSQYRSCIFYRDENQKETAERVIQILRDKGDEVNTLLLPEEPFYIGEAYHQNYYEKTGGEPYCHMRTRKF